jgi:predicted O-methyltransferase YrrM
MSTSLPANTSGFPDLESEVASLREEVAALKLENADLYVQLAKEGGWAAGHYYSPIPDYAEVQRQIELKRGQIPHMPDLDLNHAGQESLLEEFASYQSELPFPEEKSEGLRYFHNNEWFTYADAIFLHCLLRKHQPQRIIEVGSGFSSAVMLDTIDRFFSARPEVTLIEPYPERLRSLLFERDLEQVTIFESKVQEVPLEVFSKLQAGDLLFIDSSHVIKCGGDLQFLMFEVLPLLPSGVFVHFHDIFYPFEYPETWLLQARNWNELYLLRAFLAHNRDWEIHFFNSYVAAACPDLIASRLPLCSRSAGGSIYLRRL